MSREIRARNLRSHSSEGVLLAEARIPVLGPDGRFIRWLAAGSARRDDGIDLTEEVDHCDREERRADKRQDLRLWLSVLRATARAVGRAATLVQPVRPTWPIATKFRSGI